MLEVWIGIIATSVLLYWSRRSFSSPRLHGFYRTFAFQAILFLILLRLRTWFYDPFAWHQVFSWILLAGSLVLARHGFFLLKKVGRPDGRIENTTVLVRAGAYRWIRHPLYTSLLLLGWGVYFKKPDLVGFLLAVVASVFLYATAVVEERENLARFGASYTAYLQDTHRFIPYLF